MTHNDRDRKRQIERERGREIRREGGGQETNRDGGRQGAGEMEGESSRRLYVLCERGSFDKSITAAKQTKNQSDRQKKTMWPIKRT